MAPDADDPGFLSRWSRRKAEVRRHGDAVEVAPPPSTPTALADRPPSTPTALADRPPSPLPAGVALGPLAPAAAPQRTPTAPPPAPLPTLADVAALTRESDYRRFVVRSVEPDVRNAALAKLFTDPHFNLMDGLDVYIDDYGKPDPLPPGMLRQMLQAHVLGLFDEEDDAAKKAAAAAAAPVDPVPTTAPLPPDDAAALPPLPEPSPDEDTDLQLQPDDGARRAGAAAGAGEDAGQPH